MIAVKMVFIRYFGGIEQIPGGQLSTDPHGYVLSRARNILGFIRDIELYHLL